MTYTETIKLSDFNERHPGLTPALGEVYAETAAICFSRYHVSPVEVTISHEKEEKRLIEYAAPTAQAQNAHANETDCTESGAYGVALATLENLKGLVAIRRAETLSGADWYVSPSDAEADDLEDATRVEVSGVSAGNSSDVKLRLQQKIAQTQRGKSNLPAVAVVVGFRVCEVAISNLGDKK